MDIINLTQHVCTPEQVSSGVFEPRDKEAVKRLLTFDSIPSQLEMTARARALVDIAMEMDADAAMIGGAPFFMGTLELAFAGSGVKPLFAFSERKSIETTSPNGEVVKSSVFVHTGFVEPTELNEVRESLSYYRYMSGR